MDETDLLVLSCLEADEDPWAALCAAALSLPDPIDLWLDALPLLVERRRYVLADRVMVEKIRPDTFFTAQPDLMHLHALTLQALGRPDEALVCVRSALQDMFWHEPYKQLEAALLAAGDRPLR